MDALATSSMPVARYAVDLVDRAAPAAVTPATLAVAVLLADQAAVPAEVLAAEVFAAPLSPPLYKKNTSGKQIMLIPTGIPIK